jgi:hypothetical protein
MAYTLAQAASATGRDRSTLLKAIKSGKISAARDETTGAWRVDAAELVRVYGIGGSEANSEPSIGDAPADMRLLLEVERTKAAGFEARLADMARVNDDLRRRLDQADTDRRQALDRLAVAQERIAALLTDQRTVAPSPRRSWLPWRRRG